MNVNVNLIEENLIQINSGIMVNVDVSVKNIMYVWNPFTCNCENGKYLASIMDDPTITCDDIVEPLDEETNFNEKKATCKTQTFYILLAFLLFTIALLIAVSIYCHFIKSNKAKTFFTISQHK